MMFKSKKSQRFVSTLLVVIILLPSLVVFSAPNRARAVTDVPAFGQRVVTFAQKLFSNIKDTFIAGSTGTTAGIKTKELAKDILMEVAKAAAMKALQEVTKSTINWINGGYHGRPLFLENPESFFKDIEKFEVRTLVDLYGYDELKFPFGKDFALNTIYAYKSQLADNSTYSLSSYLVNDPVLLKNYQNDFSVGGWDGFLLNTQFPQNNYIGFQMIANEELAGRLQGKSGTAKDKVQKLLDQGMGFLSPQTCQTNPSYNDLQNEFNPPKWDHSKYLKDHPYDPPSCDGSTPDLTVIPGDEHGCRAAAIYDISYTEKENLAKSQWEDPAGPNVCPPRKDGTSGLINTTPGSVIANQIIKSVQSPSTLKEQAVNSGTLILSAVFDQLITKFVDKGLSSLTSAINPPPKQEDTWSYNGLTLGSGSTTVGGYGDPWDAGPDEVVTVTDFKEKLDQDIEKTDSEIKYMTNDVPDSFGPGTLQVFGQIWPKVQKLDVCQPGPDLGWQTRVDLEINKSIEKMNLGESESSSDIGTVLKELQFAANSLKDWVNTQLKYTLPSSASFMNAIGNLVDLSQQALDVQHKIDTKEDVLGQLRIMKTRLDAMPPMPAEGSEDEDTLLSLWAQYKSLASQITNDITLTEARSERDVALAKRDGLDQLIIKCGEERTAKGWDAEGGPDSKLSSSQGATEQLYFCDWPIAGGYTHKMFINPDKPAYPQIPLINAQQITVGTATVDVNLSCSTIFNANTLDYKGDLPSF
jgi:hypothetical protein